MSCPNSRHDLLYELPSLEWKTGAPLGNGHLGVMAWGDGSPLCLTLDRDGLWDLRATPPPDDADYNWGTIRRLAKSGSWDELAAIMERNHYYHAPTPAKLPVGRMELWVPGSGVKRGFSARLSLRNATLTAQIGTVRLEVFVAATAPVIAVRLSGGADGIRVRWRSLSDLNAGQAQELGLERHRIVSISGASAAVQRLPDGTTSVVAWKQIRTG
ncbi:MAG TPA: glycoside hydrolase N-terminal domain-containing protein, partial [Candidatus Latescibacteria bacterium]|nr:glycoside hydrolase N-terminal domain-containing protein [Candidatus Latescibacterota bacterium]